MSKRKGFTLIEIIVVLIITSILAAIAVPNFFTYIVQGEATAAQNNLIAIYSAQKAYYLSNNEFCVSATTGCRNLTQINNTLNLNITDTNFTYKCNQLNQTGFTCIATNTADNTFTLRVTYKSATPPHNLSPIILPGGTGCTASPWTAPCNPSCADINNPSYCPS